MSGAHINWHECPACGRNKATGRSVMVALDDSSQVMIGAKVCTAKGCRAESIRGVVIRIPGELNLRNNAKAAQSVADAIQRQAADHRREAARVLEEADREDALAARIRGLHG